MSILDRIKYKLNCLIKITNYKITFGNSLDIGEHLSFRNRFSININQGGRLKIGKQVFFNNDCSINCKNEIIIGDDCIFGENVKIYDHNHIFANYTQPIYKQGYKTEPIVIGRNCWIGSNVVILPGTTIGANSIIGAGCVISGKVPEGMIVTSNRELQFKRRSRND